MRRRRILIAVAVVLALAAGVLAVLARDERGTARPGGTRRPGPSPVRGGTLAIVASEDVDSLDPQRAGRPSSWFFVRALHRGLLAYPNLPFPDGARPVPDLAERMEVSADGLRYTFRLRSGARFGAPASRPVRGPDVRAGLERFMASGADAARALGVVARIKASPLTVAIDLVRPSNDLPWILALPQASAVPRELRGRSRARPEQIAPTGPYRLAEYVPERRLRLVRNPAWSPSLDPVRAAFVDEIVADLDVPAARQVDLIRSRSADLSLDPPAVRTLPSLGGALISSAPNGCLRYLWMNTTVSPFDDLELRRAVSAAVDREAIAAAYTEGATPQRRILPARGVLPPTVFGSAGPGPAREQRVARTGPGVSAALVVGDTEIDARQASLVVRAAARVGVRLGVRTVPIASLYPDWYELPSRRVPAGLATWCADWPGLGGRAVLGALLDGRRIRARGNTVYSLLRSTTLARLIDAATRVRGEQASTKWWERADRYATGLAAVVPLAWLEEVSVVGARVRGFVPHPFFVRGDPTNVWIASRPLVN